MDPAPISKYGTFPALNIRDVHLVVCDGVECESVVEDGEEDDDDDEDEDYADREVGQLTGMSWPEH